MPRKAVAARRAIWSSWASLASAPARLTFESFDFAVPAFAFGFGDAVDQVAADLGDTRPLVRGWPQEWASQAAVLMNARRRVRPAAFAERDAPTLEMAEEFFPFFVAGSTVFLAGTEAAAAGDERPVAVDDFLGIDGLIAHRGVYVPVPGDQLGDVRRHAVHDGIGDEQPPEIVGSEPRGAPAASVSPLLARTSLSRRRMTPALSGRSSSRQCHWNSSGIGGFHTFSPCRRPAPGGSRRRARGRG